MFTALEAARLKVECFDYTLPPELIAVRPSEERDGGRLLVLDRGQIEHRRVVDLPELVPAGALLVLNDTRVRRARVFGKRAPTGGRVELLFLRRNEPLAGDPREAWQVLARSSKRLRVGDHIEAEGLDVEVLERDAEATLNVAVRSTGDVESVLARHGRLPIPPYLGRLDEELDLDRYQTVYGRRTASAAAPTAGLHLSHALLRRFEERGQRLGRLELEIGLGTFRPVLVDDLDTHPMHSERFAVGEELVRAIETVRRAGGAIVAVGTTVVRALESAADLERPGHVRALSGETRLLIQPGFQFRVVDALLTNFHMPKSTLLALVSAFAGWESLMHAYRVAMHEGYRFLSYGDAMWIPRRGA